MLSARLLPYNVVIYRYTKTCHIYANEVKRGDALNVRVMHGVIHCKAEEINTD